jgi:hypothetical protein
MMSVTMVCLHCIIINLTLLFPSQGESRDREKQQRDLVKFKQDREHVSLGHIQLIYYTYVDIKPRGFISTVCVI